MISKRNSIQTLKERYIKLYENTILNLDSSCVGLDIKGVLAKLAFEKKESKSTQKKEESKSTKRKKGSEPIQKNFANHLDSFIEIPSQIDKLSRIQLKSGVLVHDLSGIGLYTLPPMIADLWAKGEVLKYYESLILLPYREAKLILKDSNLTDTASRLSSYFNCWDLDFKALDQSKALVIIYGYPEKRCQNVADEGEEDEGEEDEGEEDEGEKILKKLIDELTQSQLSYILISRRVPNTFLFQPKNILTLSLRPAGYLSVTHMKGRANASEYLMSSQYLLHQAMKAMNHKFSNEKVSRLLEWQPKFSDQCKRLLEGEEDIDIFDLQVKHTCDITNHKYLLECYFNIFAETDIEDPISYKFQTVEEFYCAAVTAELTMQIFKSKKDEQKNGQGLNFYWIGNFLIVRNMQNNYCAIIDESNIWTAEKIRGDINKVIEKNKEKLSNEERAKFKEFLREICDSKTLVHDKALEEIENKKVEFQKTSKNKFPGTELLINALINFMKGSVEKYRQPFHKHSHRKWAYHKIQKRLNDEIKLYETNISTNSHSLTKVAREILQGKESNMLDFTLGLVAIFFAETKRYPLNFLVTLCLLDVIEWMSTEKETQLWRKFYAHPEHLKMAGLGLQKRSIEDKIINNIVCSLGGLNAMSPANSYLQTNNYQVIDNEEQNVQPTFGLHWVDFKSSLIIMKWLEIHINQCKDIHPHLKAEIVNHVKPNQTVLHFNKEIVHEGMGPANSYVAHRFATRLEDFKFLLIPSKPIREELPKNYLEMYRKILDSTEFINLTQPLEILQKESLEDCPFASLSILTRLKLAIGSYKQASDESKDFFAKQKTKEANIEDPLNKCLAGKTLFKMEDSSISNQEEVKKNECQTQKAQNKKKKRETAMMVKKTQDKYNIAFKELEYVLSIDPDFNQVFLLLTSFYLEVNQDEQAKKTIKVFLNSQLGQAIKADQRGCQEVYSLLERSYQKVSQRVHQVRNFMNNLRPGEYPEEKANFEETFRNLEEGHPMTNQGEKAIDVLEEIYSSVRKELNKKQNLDSHQVLFMFTRFFIEIKQDPADYQTISNFFKRMNKQTGDLYSIGLYLSLCCNAKLELFDEFDKQFEEYTFNYGANKIICPDSIVDNDYDRIFGLRGLIDYKQGKISEEMYWNLEFYLNNLVNEEDHIVRILSQQILEKYPNRGPSKRPEEYIILF